MTDDELLAAVLRERYGPSKWWVFRPSPTVKPDRRFMDDNELVCARRRKALVEAARDDERQAS